METYLPFLAAGIIMGLIFGLVHWDRLALVFGLLYFPVAFSFIFLTIDYAVGF